MINNQKLAPGVSRTSFTVTSEPPYQGEGHHEGMRPTKRRPSLFSEIDSYDFSHATRDEAKRLARTLINSVTIIFIGYITAGFAIFFGLFLCGMREVENAASNHYDCLQNLRPIMNLQMNLPRNQDGFQRILNTNDQDEEINRIPQRIVIPRGNIIN